MAWRMEQKVGWLRDFAQVKSEKHYERQILMVLVNFCVRLSLFPLLSLLLFIGMLCLLLRLRLLLLLLCFGFVTTHTKTFIRI